MSKRGCLQGDIYIFRGVTELIKITLFYTYTYYKKAFAAGKHAAFDFLTF